MIAMEVNDYIDPVLQQNINLGTATINSRGLMAVITTFANGLLI